MNIAVIFAGGSGKRMNSVAKPKQFLELNGKPIIVYTLEVFDKDSIYHGLSAAARHYPADSVVLIHDGVRPLINEETIIKNIVQVKKTGNCITCVPAIETFVVSQQDGSLFIPSRADSLIARAPQSFILKDILEAHETARI